MKTVFSNDELFHVWANKGQSEGRNSNSSLSFVVDNLYSYRMLIATRVNGKLFMREKGPSKSTSRHLSDARRAVHEEVHYVPDLSGHIGKPELGEPYAAALSCLDTVQGLMRSIGTMRSLAKQQAALEQAKKYESTAKLLLNGWKWPIREITEADRRLGSEDLRALSVEYAKADHIAEYSLELKTAQDFLNLMESLLGLDKTEEEWLEDSWRDAARILSLKTRYTKVTNSAANTYKLVYDKPSTELDKLKAKYAKLMLVAEPRLKALETREVDRLTESQTVHLINATVSGCRLRTVGVSLRQLLKENPNTKHKAAAELALKDWDAKQLIANQQEFSDMLQSLRASSAHPEDKLNICTALAATAVKITELGGEVGSDVLAEVAAMEAPLKEAVDAAYKASLVDWLNGSSNSRPAHSSGTFARIKGDTVETNLGAVVPLKHAQRLAKIAQRVIKSGGKTWLPGSGPKVGYYEVKSIAADGTTVIGCHNFSAEVANTMITKLLENVNEETFNHDDSALIGAC